LNEKRLRVWSKIDKNAQVNCKFCKISSNFDEFSFTFERFLPKIVEFLSVLSGF